MKVKTLRVPRRCSCTAIINVLSLELFLCFQPFLATTCIIRHTPSDVDSNIWFTVGLRGGGVGGGGCEVLGVNIDVCHLDVFVFVCEKAVFI